jgi:serine/threonine protein kinase
MLESGVLLQNRYEIIQPIGNGGMGAVYLARDQRLGNTIALKETFFNDAMMLAAFEREAKLLAGLRHAALPKVIDHFADDHGQFLVMEFISGDDLQDLLLNTQGGFQPQEVLQWADQILDALDYLHSQNPQIIHRDIKPQNLKLSSRNQIVLLDFGLAKSSAGNSTTTTSGKSLFAYTPVYAPLEQIQGAGTDARSDIYSLGATLYHLLTGDKPVDALARASSFLNGKQDPLPLVHEKNPRVSQAVSLVVQQAMSLNRDLRPETAIIMRKLLRDAVQSETRNLVIEGKTIVSSAEASGKAFNVSSAETAKKAALNPPTQGQATPNTDANQARKVATDPQPTSPKYTSPNRALQSQRPTVNAWPSTSVPSQVKETTGRGKLILLAVAVLVVGVFLAFRLNRNSNPDGSGTVQTTPPAVEQSNVQNSSDTGNPKASPTTTGEPYQFPATSVQSQPVTQQQETTQKVAEEKPASAEEQSPKTTEQAEAKKEPEKEAKREPSKSETSQVTPAFKQVEGPREDGRRPPPPGMQPPPPQGGPPPPPPHGGPMPDRRRP